MFYVVRFFCYISIEYIEMLISLTYSRRNTRLKDLEFFNIKHLIIKREKHNEYNNTDTNMVNDNCKFSKEHKNFVCLEEFEIN